MKPGQNIFQQEVTRFENKPTLPKQPPEPQPQLYPKEVRDKAANRIWLILQTIAVALKEEPDNQYLQDSLKEYRYLYETVRGANLKFDLRDYEQKKVCNSQLQKTGSQTPDNLQYLQESEIQREQRA